MLKYTDITTKHLHPKLNGLRRKWTEKIGGSLRVQILMCHAIGLMSLRLECSVNSACVTVSCLQEVARMPFVFSHVEYCDMYFYMDFATAMHMLLLKNIKGVFPTEGFRLDAFLRVLTRNCVILAVFPVLLYGPKGRWY